MSKHDDIVNFLKKKLQGPPHFFRCKKEFLLGKRKGDLACFREKGNPKAIFIEVENGGNTKKQTRISYEKAIAFKQIFGGLSCVADIQKNQFDCLEAENL